MAIGVTPDELGERKVGDNPLGKARAAFFQAGSLTRYRLFDTSWLHQLPCHRDYYFNSNPKNNSPCFSLVTIFHLIMFAKSFRLGGDFLA